MTFAAGGQGQREIVNPFAHDPVHAAAWLGCVLWAVKEPSMLAAYRAETGDHYSAPKSPLESMIDTATGVDLAWAQSFCAWVTQRIYGSPTDLAGGIEGA